MRWLLVSMRSAAALLTLGGAVLAGSCTTAPDKITHTTKAQEELAQALAGRTAGRAVDCIYNYPANQIQVIDQWTILFRSRGNVYVQNPRGGCSGIGTPDFTLVTKQVGTTQICSGDIGNLVDLRTGSGGGSCVFGPFVPYTKSS